MSSLSFIDFLFPQFNPNNWMNGISIFNSSGVQNVQAFGELVSGRVKAGIGENYEVRMKLHSHGKCVQWMECTCQAYRRRSEKCAHLAAFCIYLDQEKQTLLSRFGLSSGGSDRYLSRDFLSSLAEKSASIEAEKGAVGEKHQRSDVLQKIDNTSMETLVRNRFSQIKSLQLIEDEGLLRVSLVGDSGKTVAYQLRCDDALNIVNDPQFADLVPAKLKSAPPVKVSRIFDIKKQGKFGIRVSRCLNVQNEETGQSKVIKIEDLPDVFIGRRSCFLKKTGFIPYSDNLSQSQILRWEEYAKTADLEGDVAAALFQSQFQRLRETCEVRLSEEIVDLKVTSKIDISSLNLKQASDGSFLVEPIFGPAQSGEGKVLDGASSEDMPGSAGRKRQSSQMLLALLRARQEGRQYLATKEGWIQISEGLDWLQNRLTADGKLRLSPLEFIKFREQVASGSEIHGQGEVIERIRAGLVSANSISLPDLSQTKLSLRPYQEEGLKWLWWLYSNGLGGLLADEMGLGKTHQAMGLIASIAASQKGGMSLVVCPTTVLDHWVDKMQAFVPHLKTQCFHGNNRRLEIPKGNDGHLVVVTSYGILLRDIQNLMALPWNLILLDEAHLVKNQTTRTYRAACRIRSRMRLCLTGTPLENDLLELKNLFDFIAPNYLGTDADFKRKYANESGRDAIAELELQRMIHPFKLRRNKKDVLTDLPEKVEDIRHCHLNKEQYDLYAEALALRGAPLVESLSADVTPVSFVHVFAVISLLKQICNDPYLIDPRYDKVGSGKMDLFEEILQEALEADQKVVVFSQYAKMVNRLSSRLTQLGIQHVTLTGQTTHRGEVVKKFQNTPEVKVFLGSLLAGGTGIDLTAASVVIHFDRWWNAAKENQATDRIHRIGQNRNVQVYKLITKGTLEERIDEIINRKRMLFDRFVEQDDEMFKHLSRQDLLELLAPPEDYQGIDVIEKESLSMDELVGVSVELI